MVIRKITLLAIMMAVWFCAAEVGCSQATTLHRIFQESSALRSNLHKINDICSHVSPLWQCDNGVLTELVIVTKHHSELQELPESISELPLRKLSLQIPGLISLPSSLVSMPLESLEISGCYNLDIASLVTLNAISTLKELKISGNPTTKLLLSEEQINSRSSYVDPSHSMPYMEMRRVPALIALPQLTKLVLDNLDIRTLDPTFWDTLESLEHLQLIYNPKLSWIPGWSSMKKLKVLDISYNGITELPDNLFDASPELTHLLLDGSLLPHLPSSISALRNLKYLSCNGCGLTSIPSLQLLTELQELYLAKNNFQEMPTELCQIPRMTHGPYFSLDLSGNPLFKSVSCFSSSSGLQSLDLSRTSFNLDELNEFSSLAQLKSLVIDEIEIRNIDAASLLRKIITTFPGLQSLSVKKNHLIGTFDTFDFGQTHLLELNMDGNQVSGSLPKSAFIHLQSLSIRDNQITSFPSQVNSGSLQRLDVGKNSISHLPDWISELPLHQGFFDSNPLGGLIPIFWVPTAFVPEGMPPDISTCRSFSFANAGFHGTLPQRICQFQSNLCSLDVSSNHLSGSIPDLDDCYRLTRFKASENSFDGSMPKLPPGIMSTLDLHQNSLSGPISSSFFSSEHHIQNVDISSNDFSGPLPSFESPFVWKFNVASNDFDLCSEEVQQALSPFVHCNVGDNQGSDACDCIERYSYCGVACQRQFMETLNSSQPVVVAPTASAPAAPRSPVPSPTPVSSPIESPKPPFEVLTKGSVAGIVMGVLLGVLTLVVIAVVLFVQFTTKKDDGPSAHARKPRSKKGSISRGPKDEDL